jgi:hypothetical protein
MALCSVPYILFKSNKISALHFHIKTILFLVTEKFLKQRLADS